MQTIVISDIEIKEKSKKKAAIFAYLYYEEYSDFFINKLLEYSANIPVFIITSNENIVNSVKEKYESKITCILKENRGRDVSALLVTLKDKLKDYEYICFLHDKTAKHHFLKNDIAFWIDGMWGNLLYANWYVESVVNYLENGYGLLLPPKPIGTYMDSYYTDSWGDNYENVCRLAEKLELKTNINKECMDEISLGTAFWCNTRALKKLFDYDWKYEDFIDEPMPDDGTISHAIERILGFVTLDAGYKIATIMNTEYVARLVDVLGDKLKLTYRWMNNNLGIRNTYQLENYDKEKYKVDRIFTECKQVFLYGAGYYGEKYLRRLEFWGYHPTAFIVTDGMISSRVFNNLPVYELSEIDEIEKIGIIVSVNPDLQEDICEILKSKGYTNFVRATVL